MSAGRVVGASGMRPVGSMTVSCAALVQLVMVSNGRRVMVSVYVMVSCDAILDVRRHPKAWSPCLSKAVPQMHCVVSGMMGSRDLRWRRAKQCQIKLQHARLESVVCKRRDLVTPSVK